MKELIKKEIIVPFSLSFLLMLGCNGLNSMEAGVTAKGNATPIPLGTLLGCEPVDFGDTGLNVAEKYGGEGNDIAVLYDNEGTEIKRKEVVHIGSLPLNPEKGVTPSICIYERAE